MDEGMHQRAGGCAIVERPHLGLEERGDEERVSIELEGADFVLVIYRRHAELRSLQQAQILAVEPEAAMVFLDRLGRIVRLADEGTLREMDSRLHSGQRAAEGCD